MMLLPELELSDFMRRFRRDFSAWRPALEAICREHAMGTDELHPFIEGSNLIARVANDRVVKIFPEFHRHQWESEWRTLHHLQSAALSIRIPKLIAHGQRPDGWTYVIVECLPGVLLEEIWGGLTDPEKSSLFYQIGQAMASVHRIGIGALKALPPEWTSFLEKQAGGAFQRHQAKAMPDWFLRGLNDFVSGHRAWFQAPRSVILTGEYTPFNLLAEKRMNQWELTGMIDFGDAMIGAPEYDFLGPLLFLAEGKPALSERFFEGYGERAPAASWLMCLAILHRYSDLKQQVRIPAWETRVQSVQALMDLIFPSGRHVHGFRARSERGRP
ncbi:aminoglycoside phosphotransferase family protein [Stigmatella hybrida]|uniref:aminoglycoside phosphotransferase family protein n=1 Tax=Stigmatella hybrida TaxID=394097 RepID=UPI001CDAF88E|nr:aminoglycoside 3'-phosphotransferase/choline kinase family protein [Stigmatella hybrida]